MTLGNDKLITGLLMIAVISSVVGNLYAVIQNEDIRSDQQKALKNQQFAIENIIDHNEAVSIHANETARALNNTERTILTIENALENQTADSRKFQMHINQTATAAPVVLELKQDIAQILALLNNSNSSSSSSSNSSSNAAQR